MIPARLHGRNHELIGRVSAIAEGACAIAISRGGAAKTYHYKHPNEDSAAFAIGAGGCLVAVADAHGGCDASEIALERLLRESAEEWTTAAADAIARSWPGRARDAIAGVHDEILQAVARGTVQSSRTTLAFALVRPADDLLAIGAIGDSHAFAVDADGARELARAPEVATEFLGGPADEADALRARCTAVMHPLGATRAVLLVTDGLSESGIGVDSPEAAAADAIAKASREPFDLRPLAAARGVVEAALEAHLRNDAGDNVASAVIWLAR